MPDPCDVESPSSSSRRATASYDLRAFTGGPRSLADVVGPLEPLAKDPDAACPDVTLADANGDGVLDRFVGVKKGQRLYVRVKAPALPSRRTDSSVSTEGLSFSLGATR